MGGWRSVEMGPGQRLNGGFSSAVVVMLSVSFVHSGQFHAPVLYGCDGIEVQTITTGHVGHFPARVSLGVISGDLV